MPESGPSRFRDVRRILVIKWSALGDAAVASAAMEDIHAGFPGAEIDFNTQPAVARLFAHDSRFRKLIVLDMRRRGERLRNALAWLKQVRAGHYDMIVDLQGTDRTRLMLILLRLIGGGPRYLFGTRGGFPYTARPEVSDKAAPAMTQLGSLLDLLGVPARTDRPVLHAGEAHLARARQVIAESGLQAGRYAVLLPGSQAAGWLKRWGTARFGELGRRLVAMGLDKVVVIGGPDEIEDCQTIAAAGAFMVNLNGRLDLLEIAPVCAGAAVIIGNDTGTAHIAASADRPMLILCGPTPAGRVKPIGSKVHALQAQVPCRNCYAKHCPDAERHVCMAVLTPEFVAAEVAAMLGGPANAVPSEVVIDRC
ncbi:MAG: glycosyltransferase family 9 protein [Gallionellaceae bacterium]|nr:glycosyltransferase family 9 protein [Gallionellaceae bacterium]